MVIGGTKWGQVVLVLPSGIRWYLVVPVLKRLCHCQVILDVSRQALTRFSISRKSREEMVYFFLSRAGELNVFECQDFEEIFFAFLSKFKILKKISLSLLD